MIDLINESSEDLVHTPKTKNQKVSKKTILKWLGMALVVIA